MNINRSVFIVDDDPFCRNIFRQHLRNLGFTRIRTFADGQECLNNLTDQPDIVFLDYEMEPLNGLEVLRKIKRVNPDVYLIIVSGQEDMQVAINALKYGAIDYIIKGEQELAMMDKVLAKVDQVAALLEQRRPRRNWYNLFRSSSTVSQ